MKSIRSEYPETGSSPKRRRPPPQTPPPSPRRLKSPSLKKKHALANYNKDDVLQAEFYRTSNFAQFLGGNILRLLRAQKKQSLSESTQCTFFRKRIGFEKRKEGFEAPWEAKYGFRGTHPAFYYLSPWEFTQWWYCDR